MTSLDNPFAILTAVVAPAVLTNACSVLSLGAGNRIARVVDRTRVLSSELKQLEPGDPEYIHRTRQLDRLRERGKALLRAMRSFYAALGCFATAALLSVVGSVFQHFGQEWAFRTSAATGLIVGAIGVVTLAAGSGLMVRETQLALDSMTEAAELARHEAHHHPHHAQRA